MNSVYVMCWLQSGRKATPFGIARNLQQIGSTLKFVFSELVLCILKGFYFTANSRQQ